MQEVVQAAGEGLRLVFAWPNILYPVIGTLLAMTFAAMPGLSGVTLMAIMIPFTFSWEPLPVMLLFGALVGGATFMGSVTAILLNIPGTGPNAATLIDGYPLSRRGQAKTAIACSALSSALGSTFGVVVLILLIPVMRQWIMAFGPAEFLMLALWGITTVAAVARGSVVKGLAMTGIGLMISFVGLDPRTAELRYTFGTLHLRDGISLVPVFLGIFAVAEMIDLTVKGRTTISGSTKMDELSGKVSDGFRAVLGNFGLFIRSSVIGTLVGLIPGTGGTVAGFVAYGQAVQTARKDRDRFGRGDLRGVLAPEAANDAKDGASLIPTLAFGVPGSEGTALLLAALTLHGLVPGRELMTGGLSLVFALIWSLFFSNWLSSILGVAMVDRLAWFTVLPLRWLAPVIFILSSVGAQASKGRFADVAVLFGFGLFGYYMKKYRWPRICFVIALVLGPLLEMNLHLTLQLHRFGRITLWSRPLALAILFLAVVSLMVPFVRKEVRAGAGAGAFPSRGGAAFSFLLLAASAGYFLLTTGLGGTARLVPMVVVIPTLALLFVVLCREPLRPAGKRSPGAFPRRFAPQELRSLGWVLLLPALLLVFGFRAGAPAYVFLYLRRRSGEGVTFSLAGAAATWLFLSVLFSAVLRTSLHEGLLGRVLPF